MHNQESIEIPQTPLSNQTRQVVVRSTNAEVVIGGREVVVFAGPCSIESRPQLTETALSVARSGARLLRGGIYKMRTSAESFQGLGDAAFEFISEVKREAEMPLVSEITDPRQIEVLGELIDMFQIGSRNMFNYELLKEVGQQPKPVMLKRSFAANIEEWVKAAQYIERGGNRNIVLCERGIRTFETATRNTLDLNAVAYIKQHTDLPIIVDPSHGTGRPELIPWLSCAAVAAGADGVMIEVHPRPKEALSDGFQALTPAQFEATMRKICGIAQAMGREV